MNTAPRVSLDFLSGPLISPADPLVVLTVQERFAQALGISEDFLTCSAIATTPVPDPYAADTDPDSTTADLIRKMGVPAQSLWHPLFWLPQRLRETIGFGESDGGSRDENLDEWVFRVLTEIEYGDDIYHEADGSWIDCLAVMGIDRSTSDGIARIEAWLNGAADEVLDSFTLENYLATETPQSVKDILGEENVEYEWWAFAYSITMAPIIAGAGRAQAAHDVTEIINEALDTYATTLNEESSLIVESAIHEVSDFVLKNTDEQSTAHSEAKLCHPSLPAHICLYLLSSAITEITRTQPGNPGLGVARDKVAAALDIVEPPIDDVNDAIQKIRQCAHYLWFAFFGDDDAREIAKDFADTNSLTEPVDVGMQLFALSGFAMSLLENSLPERESFFQGFEEPDFDLGE